MQKGDCCCWAPKGSESTARVSRVACRGRPPAAEPGRRPAQPLGLGCSDAITSEWKYLSQLKCASKTDASSIYLDKIGGGSGNSSPGHGALKNHTCSRQKIAQGFLPFLSAYLIIFIHYSFEFSYWFRMFTALWQCWKQNIFSLMTVLKFYHPTYNLFLLGIQAEILFHVSNVFTVELCNLWFVSVWSYDCQITIISEVLLTTSFYSSFLLPLWWQMRWALKSTCAVLAWVLAIFMFVS